MPKITIIQGHPDPRGGHYCNALADAYADGASRSNYRTRRVETAKLEFPLLESQDDYVSGKTPETLLEAQADLLWADHYVIVYPLWLGTMPAKLKGFLEQVFRPDVAFGKRESGQLWTRLLEGKSARVILTMGMPAPVYRWYFGAHGLKNLKRNILGFVGVKPIRTTFIGMVEGMSNQNRRRWIEKVEQLGSSAQ